jgi:hypothetical protein
LEDSFFNPIFFVGIILAILLFFIVSWIVQFLIIIFLLICGFLALFAGLAMAIYGVIMLILLFSRHIAGFTLAYTLKIVNYEWILKIKRFI